MRMDACTANSIDDADSKFGCNSLSNGVASCENGIIEPTMLMELLTSLDLDLAYFSEKLVNLDLYMTIVSLGEIGLGELSMQNSNISEIDIEKALIFDLSFGFLDSEVIELGSFLEVLQAKMIEAHQNIYYFKERREIFSIFQGKLQASENSWNHLQEQLSELKRQLANFYKTLSIFREKSSKLEIKNEDLERSHYDLQIAGQQRLVLKMLEKSLAAELNLEKKLIESKKREAELQSELLLANEVVSGGEAFLGVVIEKLLEAEHSSQVFMGIAKEAMSRLQISEFNMHCSVWREKDMKSKLEISLRKLQEKENVEQKFKKLDEKFQASELKLQEVNAAYEAIQDQLSEMEITAESLREHAFMAETRAHDAEEKLATLTEENVELREEVGFLKAGDSNEEKISLLEKQVRDLDVKLQTSKTSAEASQEQQNMLYTAIWDMETLIEELKSKVSKAESRTESAEQQCLTLAETNLELNKEKGFLKSENEKLLESLKEANKTKVARAKDVNNGAKLITEMVAQLVTERERLQKLLSSLARENTILLEELLKMRKNIRANQGSEGADRKESDSVIVNPAAGISKALDTTEEVVETPTSATASNQVDELSEENNTDEAEAAGSCRFAADLAVASTANGTNYEAAEAAGSFRINADIAAATAAVAANYTDHDEGEASGSSRSNAAAEAAGAANCTKHENAGKMKSKHMNKKSYIFAAGFIFVFSILAMITNWQDIYLIMRRQNLNLQ